MLVTNQQSLHPLHVAFDVTHSVLRIILGLEDRFELYHVRSKSFLVQVEHIYISKLHTNKEMSMIQLLGCQERRYIETTHSIAILLPWMWYRDLNVTITQVLHIPQLKHVGRVYRDQNALIRYECNMVDHVVMSIIDLKLVALQGEDLDHASAGPHRQHALVLSYPQI